MKGKTCNIRIDYHNQWSIHHVPLKFNSFITMNYNIFLKNGFYYKLCLTL
jgi:hypothetical protein